MENNKPKIFAFINGHNAGGYQVLAIDESGTVLAGHVSSSEGFAKHDIGINGEWKHDKYKERFPDGYDLVWVDTKEKDLPKEFLSAIESGNATKEE